MKGLQLREDTPKAMVRVHYVGTISCYRECGYALTTLLASTLLAHFHAPDYCMLF